MASPVRYRYAIPENQTDRVRGVGRCRLRRRAGRRRDLVWRTRGASRPGTAAATGTDAPLERTAPDDERKHPAGSPLTGASTACPLCHTPGPALGDVSETSGASWRCAVCDQVWNARRLATVAAYADYCAQRNDTISSAPKLD